MAADQDAVAIEAAQGEQKRSTTAPSDQPSGGPRQPAPHLQRRGPGGTRAAKPQVTDKAALIDQPGAEQQPEPVGMRLLAQEALGKRGVQDTGKPLARPSKRRHLRSIPHERP